MKFISIGSGATMEVGGRLYAYVDTEEQFEAALAAGYNIVLRGGAEHSIACTRIKNIVHPHTHIVGPCELVFTLDHTVAYNVAMMISADDCVLENFKMRSTAPTHENTTLFGLVFATYEAKGHRTVLRNLEIYEGWNRCLAKYGASTFYYIEDVLIEHCYFHTFSAYPAGAGLELCGFRRLVMRDCRIIAALTGETHLTGYGIQTGKNTVDCVMERVYVSNCMGMGIESCIAPYDALAGPPTTENLRSVFRDVVIENCEDFGLSIGHGKGTIVDNVRIKDVRGRGIEFGAYPADRSWGSIINCRVDGVRDSNRVLHPGMAEGIAIDKQFDSTVMGCWVKNVVSTMLGPPHARGCFVFEAYNCHIHGNTFEDIGGRYVDTDRGTGPLSGHHVVENNVFRQSTVQPATVAAVYCTQNYLYARNNTAFKKTGSNLGYFVMGSAGVPASVWSENNGAITSFGTAMPFDGSVTTGGFVSSNIIQTIS